jgi:mono/diheme cytochrome c family protein
MTKTQLRTIPRNLKNSRGHAVSTSTASVQMGARSAGMSVALRVTRERYALESFIGESFMRNVTRRVRVLGCAIGALALFLSAACGAGAKESTPSSAAASTAASASTTPDGLTPFQVEHGIGPVTAPVALNGIDKAMAESGEEVFEQKCAACHKMGERYVGPPLGEVTKRRSPAFVMNMVLNPQEMVEKHPVSRKLLGEFFVAMPNQNLSPAEARQVLEYLRTQTP